MASKLNLSGRIKAVIVLIASVISAILYRMGGSGNFPRQCRLVGVPILCTLLLWLLAGWNWWFLLCIPLQIGAISTYWKRKGTDAGFWNYYLHGLGLALAFLPYAISTHLWLGFAIRGLSLPFLVAWWATYMNKPFWIFQSDVVSEIGRGFFIASTIPLLTL